MDCSLPGSSVHGISQARTLEWVAIPFSKAVFPDSSVGKESTCNAGDPGSVPGLGRSPGEGISYPTPVFLGFPCGSAGKESACNAGDLGLIPGLRRSPGEGTGYPLQDSGLENSMDCKIRGVPKSWTRLNDFHFHFQILQGILPTQASDPSLLHWQVGSLLLIHQGSPCN